MNIPKFSGTAPTDDRTILDTLRGSEVIRKAIVERDSQVLAFRKTAAEKLAKIEAAAEVSFPKLRAARDAAIAAARAAEIEWHKACDLARQAQINISSASQYILIDDEIKSALSVHARFDVDEVVFRFTWRVDGKGAYSSPITPLQRQFDTLAIRCARRAIEFHHFAGHLLPPGENRPDVSTRGPSPDRTRPRLLATALAAHGR